MAKAGGGGGGTSRFRSTTTGGSITKINEAIDGVNPFIQVSYKKTSVSGETVTETTTVSGTDTDTLTIKCDSVKTQTVSCEINGSSIPTTPTSITSDDANFYTISQSNLESSEVVLETINDSTGDFSVSTTNLFQKNLQVDVNDDNYLNSFVIYSTKDVPVRITLDGGGGKGNSNHRGGKGGRTIFDYTLLANTEYVLKLGKTVGPAQSSGGGGPAAYFYEQGTLLVCSGGGGGAGTAGAGGNGGGAGIKGSAGQGSGAGSGGTGVLNGALPATGVLVSGRNGGRVEPCTTGYYWDTQGKAPCEKLGNIKFRTAEGIEVGNSSQSINRGFKADIKYPIGQYGYRFNGGNSGFQGSGGGSGAIGGTAATSETGGGGGGSGYSNGSVTIVSTTTADFPQAKDADPFSAKAIIQLRT